MNLKTNLLIIFVVLALGTASFARQPEISVGESIIPPLGWGKQVASFEITNNTGRIKFIRARVEVKFEGTYLSPYREVWSNSLLSPSETKTISVDFYVPGNFGRAKANFFLYDVVDTLDEILTGQMFFEQPAFLNFRIPEGMYKYVTEKITMPPRVDALPDFDHEFSRSLLLMLNDGMSVDEIARIAGTDSSLVSELLSKLYSSGYARVKKIEGISLSFPVIKLAEAEEERQLALEMSEKLADEIQANIPAYLAVVDSLVKAGKVSADRYEFMNGGTILYHQYPVIGALLLWADLGQKFITRSAPLLIYDNTDPCMAKIPYYMYAVEGGDIFNGSQFFAMSYKKISYAYHFGDSLPDLKCRDIWARGRRVKWQGEIKPEQDYIADLYMIDTLTTGPAVDALRGKAGKLLPDLYGDLLELALKHGHQKLMYGHRYWFWNLVSTRTLEKLVDRGVVTRSGNGQFRLDGRPGESQLR